MNATSKLEVVYPFPSLGKLIAWYQHNNPARQRFKYALEPDNSNFFTDEYKTDDEPNLVEAFRHHPDFSGMCIEQIYAAIAIIIKKVTESSPRLEERAFLYRFFSPVYDFSDIGYLIGRSRQMASTYCKRVEDRLTIRCCERGLINPNYLESLLHFPDNNIN